MAQRKVTFVPNEYYHLYNRGNSKQDIFLDDSDYDRFAKLLYLCNSTKSISFKEDIIQKKIQAYDFERKNSLVSIGAWVLMPNHFHLHITPRTLLGKDDSVARFLKKLCTAYSMYFNKKYNRTGKLFEGAFKSVYIADDVQAKYLFSYIHLNPVKLIESFWKEKGIQNREQVLLFLANYKWSSYYDYRDIKRPESKIIAPQDFPEYFQNVKIFNDEIFNWLDYKD